MTKFDTATVLADLLNAGVRLERAGDRLRFHPQHALTAPLAERLREHKAAVLAVLGGSCPDCGRQRLIRGWRWWWCYTCERRLAPAGMAIDAPISPPLSEVGA